MTSSTIVSVAIGALMLAQGMSTRRRLSLVKPILLRTHFRMDVLFGIVLIVAPFVLGDSDRGDATRFLAILGVLELLATLGTDWDEREEIGPVRSRRHTPTPAH